jgi:hypothetical protein
MQSNGHCVILVDFENIVWAIRDRLKSSTLSEIMDLATASLAGLRKHIDKSGMTIMIGRAYADWESSAEGALQSLALMGFQPEYVMAKHGKSSADLALSLDGQEILLTRPEIDTFIIVGSDRDYIPFARRILERGRNVKIMGFPWSASGDLRQIIGEANFLDATRFIPAGRLSVPAPTQVPAESASMTSVDKCLAAFLQFRIRVRSNEIWLGPFLRTLNEIFPTLTQEERKALVNSLKDSGAISVQSKDGTSGQKYAVAIINDDHPSVKAVIPSQPVHKEGV